MLFVGWFGPRGLASIVFALIALEDLHDVEGPVDEVVGTIGLTVLLSVLAHGLSARPLAGRYAADRGGDLDESQHPEPTVRRFVSQRSEGYDLPLPTHGTRPGPTDDADREIGRDE